MPRMIGDVRRLVVTAGILALALLAISTRASEAGVPTPTATESVTPTGTSTPAPSPFVFSFDCDAFTPGVQTACSSAASGEIDLAVVLTNNSGSDATIGAFNFKAHDPDRTRLDPPSGGSGLNGNPDFNEGELTGSWACLSPTPTNDTQEDGPRAAVSYLSCIVSAPGTAPTLRAGEDAVLAIIRYEVPSGAATGTVVLTPGFAAAFDEGFLELGSCTPVGAVEMQCEPATIDLTPPPPTQTPTPTATGTPTATPTPPGATIAQVPLGNAENVDLTYPVANLWLCDAPASCTGPGEGKLSVVEHASNMHTGDQDSDRIEDGVAAYTIETHFDADAILSVTGCDVAFSTGGAGSARGNVQEPSAGGCPANGPPTNGSCMSLNLSEGFARFACLTHGTTPGPVGVADLARLTITVSPGVRSLLYPGVGNGIATSVMFGPCIIRDTFGIPVLNSEADDAIADCGRLIVDVRILEGDVNLDCRVDVQDDQLMAYHLGSVFGSPIYSPWYDLEPAGHDLDIDSSDLQRVFGRNGSTCQAPIPAQSPLAVD